MALSTRDRDRLKILSEAKKGLITQKQATQHLDVTERQIRRMVTRMREQGDRGILHGLRCQPSIAGCRKRQSSKPYLFFRRKSMPISDRRWRASIWAMRPAP